MLTYLEAAALWKEIDAPYWKQNESVRKVNRQHKFFKRLWDSQTPALKPGEEAILLLSKMFPNDPDCSSAYPLGKFKELEGWTHKEIYEHWVEKFTNTLINRSGNKSSIAFTCGTYMIHKYLEYNDEVIEKQEASEAMSLMLYRSAFGMVLEDRAHQELIEFYETNSENQTYRPAPHEMEKEGLDGYSHNTWNKKNEIDWFSMKSLGGLNDDYIMSTRADQTKTRSDGTVYTIKGKTKATIYAGYESIDSHVIILKMITINAITKKEELTRISLFDLIA